MSSDCCSDSGNFTSHQYGCEKTYSHKNFHIRGSFNPITCELSSKWQSIGNDFAVATDGTLWSINGIPTIVEPYDDGVRPSYIIDTIAAPYVGLPNFGQFYQVDQATDWIKIIPGESGIAPDLFMKTDGSLWTFGRYGIDYISRGALNNGVLIPSNYGLESYIDYYLGESVSITRSFHTRDGIYQPYFILNYQPDPDLSTSPKQGDIIAAVGLVARVLEVVSETEIVFSDIYTDENNVILKDFLEIESGEDITLEIIDYFTLRSRFNDIPKKYNLNPENVRARIDSSIKNFALINLPDTNEKYDTLYKQYGRAPTYLDYLEFSREPNIYLKYYRPDVNNIIKNTDIDADGFYHDGFKFIRDADKSYYQNPGGIDAEFEVSWSGSIDWIKVITPGTGYITPPNITLEPTGGEIINLEEIPVPVAVLDPNSFGVLEIYLNDNPTIWKKPPNIVISPVPIESEVVDGETIIIQPGPGSGAYAVCEIKGKISQILMSNSGAGYTHAGTEFSKLQLILQASDDDFLVHGIPEFITPTPTVTPSITPSITPTSSITPTKTKTPSVTPTSTPTKSITPSPTTTPSFTPTVTVTKTVSPTSTTTQSFTPTATCTLTSSSTATPTPSITSSQTPSKSQELSITRVPPGQNNTLTPTPTITPQESPTRAATPNTPTPTRTVTVSTSITVSKTATNTPTRTLSPTPATLTPTPTRTPTNTTTNSNTPTPTRTPTQTCTQTQTQTFSPTRSPTITISPSATSVSDKVRKIAQWTIADIILESSEIYDIEFNQYLPGIHSQKIINSTGSDTLQDEIYTVKSHPELKELYLYDTKLNTKTDINNDDPLVNLFLENRNLLVAEFEHLEAPSGELQLLSENLDGREAIAEGDLPVVEDRENGIYLINDNDKFSVTQVFYYIDTETGARFNRALVFENNDSNGLVWNQFHRMIPKDVVCIGNSCLRSYYEWDPESYIGQTPLYSGYINGRYKAYAGFTYSLPGISGYEGEFIQEYDPFIGFEIDQTLFAEDPFGGSTTCNVNMSYTATVQNITTIATIGNGNVILDGFTIENHARSPNYWDGYSLCTPDFPNPGGQPGCWEAVCSTRFGDNGTPLSIAPLYIDGNYVPCGGGAAPANDGANSSIQYTFVISHQGYTSFEIDSPPNTTAQPGSFYSSFVYRNPYIVDDIVANYKISVSGNEGSNSVYFGGFLKEYNTVPGPTWQDFDVYAIDFAQTYSTINGDIKTFDNNDYTHINVGEELFLDETLYDIDSQVFDSYGTTLPKIEQAFEFLKLTPAEISLDYKPMLRYYSYVDLTPNVIKGNESAKIYFYEGAIAELIGNSDLIIGANIVENHSYNKEPSGIILKNGYDYPIRIGEPDNLKFNLEDGVVFGPTNVYYPIPYPQPPGAIYGFYGIIDSSDVAIDNGSLCVINSGIINKHHGDYVFIKNSEEILFNITDATHFDPKIHALYRDGIYSMQIIEKTPYGGLSVNGQINRYYYENKIFSSNGIIPGKYNNIYFILGQEISWPPAFDAYQSLDRYYKTHDLEQTLIDSYSIIHKNTNLSKILPNAIGIDDNENYVQLLSNVSIENPLYIDEFITLDSGNITYTSIFTEYTQMTQSTIQVGLRHDYSGVSHIRYSATPIKEYRKNITTISNNHLYSAIYSGDFAAIIYTHTPYFSGQYINQLNIMPGQNPLYGVVPLEGWDNILIYDIITYRPATIEDYIEPSPLIIDNVCDNNYNTFSFINDTPVLFSDYAISNTGVSDDSFKNNISIFIDGRFKHGLSYIDIFDIIINNNLYTFKKVLPLAPEYTNNPTTSDIISIGRNLLIDSSNILRNMDPLSAYNVNYISSYKQFKYLNPYKIQNSLYYNDIIFTKIINNILIDENNNIYINKKE